MPTPEVASAPSWILVVKELALPAATIILAIVGITISARQMVIAHDKLQDDVFFRQYERRFAIYEATREALAGAFKELDLDKIREFDLRMLEAKFTFDEEMYKYLREIGWRIKAYWDCSESAAKTVGTDESKNYIEMRGKHLAWIVAQGDENSGFSSKFIPFLTQKKVRRSWWLRWPL